VLHLALDQLLLQLTEVGPVGFQCIAVLKSKLLLLSYNPEAWIQ
jgi:hypothetical protein